MERFQQDPRPLGLPSQILGSIEAPGQVYVINQNGILFGGSSQVNTRGFVASALPINDNLLQQGLLNNRDAQFLFSALAVPGGSDGTPAFIPTTSDPEFRVNESAPTYTLGRRVALGKENTLLKGPEFVFQAADGSKGRLSADTDYVVAVDAATKRATVTFTETGLGKIGDSPIRVTYAPFAVRSGDITVQPGAVLSSPVTGDANGGRVMLAGANVRNEGTISTPSGQTILAAGLQVAVAAHAGDDPSLRGLDVWVGYAGNRGAVTNRGLIETLNGSTSLVGRSVAQDGVIESSSSVDLNGRIDIRASYGAVGNPGYDVGAEAPQFLFQKTGVVTFGPGSVTRILPDSESGRTVPGTALPERSQINVEGLAVHLGEEALMVAPNADVTIRAGIWPYKDLDGNRTTIDGRLNPPGPEQRLAEFYSGSTQRFLLSTGQIYLDPAALISVAGSTAVDVPLGQSILNVEFRGSEFADSPLQRDGVLRATPLTVDLRRSGVFGGRFGWELPSAT
jgi:hypothetical protein